MARVNELRLIARIAQMYHVEGYRQAEIAKHLRISQTTVSRMLKRALEEEIVRTSIVAPSGTFSDLETQLREKYHLPEVVIVESSQDSSGPIMSRIGEAAAHLLEATLQPNEVIGVASWSETILQMVDNIHPMRTGKAKYIVQTMGGMGDPTVQTHATQLTTRLAKLTGGEPHLLSAPGVAQSREAKLVLLSDPYIRETMDLWGKISLAIVGIGAIEPSSMLARSGNVFTPKELAELTEAGAVGDMSLRFFDANGTIIKTPLDERVIGLSLEELSDVERVIALAGGNSKTEAIHGALKTKCIDILITDNFTAERLLQWSS